LKRELIEALEQIAREKGITKELLLETIEAALITAYKKNFGTSQNVRVTIDSDTGETHVYSQREVVEAVENEFFEIEVNEAKALNPNYVLGDFVENEVTPRDFGRIAAQTAKQVVVQRIREAERSIIFDEFISRESEVVTGMIQRMNKGTIYINLGKTEAVLLPSEQITNEIYEQNMRVKAYIVEVKKTSKGPQILVSRTHPGLVRRLFELEVPEIHDGVVEIRGISREAGSRTKIAVHSVDENVDPVGACVGQKGNRVQAIVDELRGEKIDIIKWSEDPSVFISNALSPSKVEKVVAKKEEQSVLVIVPDYQLSLAIGKEGQNARLAAKLTGWKIDIKSQTQYRDMIARGDVQSDADYEEYYDEEYYDEEGYSEEEEGYYDEDEYSDEDGYYDEEGEYDGDAEPGEDGAVDENGLPADEAEYPEEGDENPVVEE